MPVNQTGLDTFKDEILKIMQNVGIDNISTILIWLEALLEEIRELDEKIEKNEIVYEKACSHHGAFNSCMECAFYSDSINCKRFRDRVGAKIVYFKLPYEMENELVNRFWGNDSV